MSYREENDQVIPHPYGCSCAECRAMVAAISAKNKDGSYFFSDEELEELLTSPSPRYKSSGQLH